MADRGRLVLARKQGERIVVTTEAGEVIVFQVLEYNARSVRLCVDAPRNVAVHREELLSEDERRALPPKARV